MDEADGDLAASHSYLSSTLAELAPQLDITSLVSLGDAGYTGHPDHIASHFAAEAAVGRLSWQGHAISHLALSHTNLGEMHVPSSPGTISRKLGAMAYHASQYPVWPRHGAPTEALTISDHAVNEKFWSDFICRSLITSGESYDVLRLAETDSPNITTYCRIG